MQFVIIMMVALNSIFEPQWLAGLTTQWVSAALIVALITACVVVVVAWQLGRSTQKDLFGQWSGGWAFYAISLAAVLVLEEVRWKAVQVVCLASGGVSALFILSVALQVSKRRCEKWVFGLVGLVVVALSCVGVFFWPHWFWLRLVVCVSLASAGGYTGWVFWRQQDRSTRILAIGLMGWAVVLVWLPVLELWSVTKVAGYIFAAAPALAVAMGMVVMEEAVVLERKYRDLLEASAAAVFVVDLWTLEVMDANRPGQLLVKHGLEELLGMRFGELCPDLNDAGRTLQDHRTAFNAVFKPYHEVSLRRKDGGKALCEGDVHLIQWRNRAALLVNLREVDKGKTVGQLVRRSEKLTSLGQLVAGVAHELNNPMAVVLGCAQVMAKQEQMDEKTRAMAEKILQESGRVKKIVSDLLSFARPGPPQMGAVDINQLVANVMKNRAVECHANNVQCEVRLGSDVPLTKADALQIEQVLTNLVANALDAMAEQGTPRKLIVTTEAAGIHIRITVSDTGRGVPPEIVARIFDPFFTTKAPNKGSGLGLSISNTIMEEHRGKIWVQSEVGHGATFHVELPIVECDPEEPAAAPAAEAAKAEPAFASIIKKRILLVDDELGIRDVLAEVFIADGYDVDTASSGEEGWKLINAKFYDVIISDLNMPVMDGAALYRQVLSMKPKQAQRMVFLTGDTVGQKWRVFLEGTKNRCLTKPFNIRQIEEVVSDMINANDDGSADVTAIHPGAG